MLHSVIRQPILRLSLVLIVIGSAIFPRPISASADSTTSSGATTCSPIPISQEFYENPDTGTLDSTAGVNDATVIEYAQPGAAVSEIRVNVPPASWRPSTATPAELSFYSVPAPPADPAGKTQWDQDWSNFSSPAPSGVCVEPSSPDLGIPNAANTLASTGTSNTSDCSNTAYFLNWAGYQDCGAGYTSFYGGVVVQNVAYCPGANPSTHAAWVGLGGWGTNDTGLLQNGIEQDQYPNVDRYWFQGIADFSGGQVLNSGPIFPFVQEPGAGDTVNMSTNYLLHSNPPGVTFGWHDLKTGFDQAWTVYNFQDISTGEIFSASEAYNGTKAEAIDERFNEPPVNFPMLRDFSASFWGAMQVAVNGGSLSPWRNQTFHTDLPMEDTLNAGGFGVLSDPTLPAWGDQTDGTDYWRNCGQYGT